MGTLRTTSTISVLLDFRPHNEARDKSLLVLFTTCESLSEVIFRSREFELDKINARSSKLIDDSGYDGHWPHHREKVAALEKSCQSLTD